MSIYILHLSDRDPRRPPPPRSSLHWGFLGKYFVEFFLKCISRKGFHYIITGTCLYAAARRGGPRARTSSPTVHGLRAPDPRRIPTVVRHEDVLGRDAGGAEDLRGQPGQRVAAQPGCGGGSYPLRSRHGRAHRDGGWVRRVFRALLPATTFPGVRPPLADSGEGLLFRYREAVATGLAAAGGWLLTAAAACGRHPASGRKALRRATVLFADIEAFTSIGETLSPQALGNIVDEYFTTVGEVIRRQGGTIRQFRGDAVVASFEQAGLDGDRAQRRTAHGTPVRPNRRSAEIVDSTSTGTGVRRTPTPPAPQWPT